MNHPKAIFTMAKWSRYLTKCNISNLFMDGFSPGEKLSLISGFAGSKRRNKFGSSKKLKLAGVTAKATLNSLRSTFRSNFRPNAFLEDSGENSIALTRQIRGYIQQDPATKHQKCLPREVFDTQWFVTFWEGRCIGSKRPEASSWNHYPMTVK